MRGGDRMTAHRLSQLASLSCTRLLAFGALFAITASAETSATPQVQQTPLQVVQQMIDNENAAAAHPERYEYISNERSARTGGHLWTERVVETPPGRMRFLLAVDGIPLPPERLQQERARIE